MPFLVIPIDTIEIIVFERINNKIKNFDLVVIFQDYSKSVKIINNIPK